MEAELDQTMQVTLALSHISSLLRDALRSSSGEDIIAEKENETADALAILPTSTATPPEVYSLERECELVRLQKENEQLRALLSLPHSSTLREEVAKETMELLEMSGKHRDESQASQMFGDGQDLPPRGYGILARGRRGGMIARGKSRPFPVPHSPW